MNISSLDKTTYQKCPPLRGPDTFVLLIHYTIFYRSIFKALGISRIFLVNCAVEVCYIYTKVLFGRRLIRLFLTLKARAVNINYDVRV